MGLRIVPAGFVFFDNSELVSRGVTKGKNEYSGRWIRSLCPICVFDSKSEASRVANALKRKYTRWSMAKGNTKDTTDYFSQRALKVFVRPVEITTVTPSEVAKIANG